MNIEDIIEFELEGISRTIIDYTNDCFIKSYAEKLLTTSYYEQRENFLKVVNRLFDWYSKQIDEILESPFAFNKDNHQFCYNLLKTLSQV